MRILKDVGRITGMRVVKNSEDLPCGLEVNIEGGYSIELSEAEIESIKSQWRLVTWARGCASTGRPRQVSRPQG